MAKQRSALRNRAEAAAFALVAGGIRALPRARAEAAGRRLGLLFRRLSRRRRELVERNLCRALPDASTEERERLAQGVFAHFGGVAFDIIASIGEPRESMLERIEVVGFERARRAYASKRGVFFLTAHLGNWEMGAIVASLLDLPMHVVSRPLDNPLLEIHLRSFREHGGNTVIPKATAARELIRVLRSGGAVGILMDQHARPPDAVAVPFFGRPASTTTAVARIADRTEALILPVSCLRTGPRRYRLDFHEVVDLRDLSSVERETAALTARLNSILESLVRLAPEQWLWLHEAAAVVQGNPGAGFPCAPSALPLLAREKDHSLPPVHPTHCSRERREPRGCVVKVSSTAWDPSGSVRSEGGKGRSRCLRP